ncbi:MAG TPA: hypothetical protein VL971_05205 [Rhizomicrobium sp.]|nr:hypothetical protein [Rhizomicrobium sp.]
MSLRNTIIGSASALALAACIASPASAMPGFNGLLGVDYSHLTVNHGGGDGNDYGGAATGMFNLGAQFALQLNGGYHHIDVSHGGGSSNDWDAGGTALWTGGMGRIGANVGYNSASASGTEVHATNYGAFGEWYAMGALTVGVKGGAFNATGSTKGDYFGGALTGYVVPDFSLRAGYDYTHLQGAGNESDLSVKAEYLLSERTPFSVYLGYTNSKIGSGGPTVGIFSVGLTFYCDPVGPESLEAHQRRGAEQWGNSFGPALLHF